MSLIETIEADFKHALKTRDQVRLSTLRMLKAAMKNKEVELRRKLDESEVISVIGAQAKQRKDSIAEFGKAGRTDLVDKETAELGILAAYLPVQISREELEGEIKGIISETGAAGPQDMGPTMKKAMSRLAGKADGRTISEIVKGCLEAGPR